MHVEIVWDLTTDSFILALRRFCSRREYPHIIQSDNGTNFIGAESELKTALNGLDKKRIEEEVNNQTNQSGDVRGNEIYGKGYKTCIEGSNKRKNFHR